LVVELLDGGLHVDPSDGGLHVEPLDDLVVVSLDGLDVEPLDGLDLELLDGMDIEPLVVGVGGSEVTMPSDGPVEGDDSVGEGLDQKDRGAYCIDREGQWITGGVGEVALSLLLFG